MPDTERINLLTLKYKRGEISPEESLELEAFFSADEANRALFEARISEEGTEDLLRVLEMAQRSKERARAKVVYPETAFEQDVFTRKWRIKRWWLAGAAASLLAISVTVIFLKNQPGIATQAHADLALQNDAAPGTVHATLRLAGGSVVALDDASKGTVAREGGAEAVKEDSGLLVFRPGGLKVAAGLNTVTTPAGGWYKVLLADGTSAYLNASSSLQFPGWFSGNRREVTMTGEVYFEVAKNPSKPFIVHAGNTSVRVLGTHFNIKAYQEAPVIKTTLVEGQVSISYGADTGILLPGDEAQTGKHLHITHGVDTDEAIAWTQGKFSFDHANIKDVMNEIARWYQVTVQYEGRITTKTITAEVKRDAYLSKVLEVLQASGYHFNVSGKTVTVMP